MKKLLIIGLLLLCLFTCSCKSSGKETKVLRIYNWQEYIDDGTDDNGSKVYPSVMEDFVDWYKEEYGIDIEVVYDTFETNEVMMNNLKTGKTTYDLVCPSDYTIQKMIRLDMLEQFDYNLLDANGNLVMSNYCYLSPYLTNLFDSAGWTPYAVPYMWGTMGFIYDPDQVDSEDVRHWDVLWSDAYENMATAKDSVRDTFVVGVMYTYYDELMEYRESYLKGDLNEEDYNKKINEVMNRCDDETLGKVEIALKELKQNLYGFEVDSGKSDIVTGKIALNFAWSGDAVFSMDVAEEENDLYLNYYIPEEGSNVWFDGWVMPKGANVELAESFINFLCRPDIASRNMDFIGYTSAVIGGEILDLVNYNYGVLPYFEEDEEGNSSWYFLGESLSIDDEDLIVEIGNGIYLKDPNTGEAIDCIQYAKEHTNLELDEFEYYKVDINHYFVGSTQEVMDTIDDIYLDENGHVVVYVQERGRQFDAQYPSMEELARCGIMEDFGDRNDAVLAMWENVKMGSLPLYITIIVVAVLVVALAVIYLAKFIKIKRRQKRKSLYEEK